MQARGCLTPHGRPHPRAAQVPPAASQSGGGSSSRVRRCRQRWAAALSLRGQQPSDPRAVLRLEHPKNGSVHPQTGHCRRLIGNACRAGGEHRPSVAQRCRPGLKSCLNRVFASPISCAPAASPSQGRRISGGRRRPPVRARGGTQGAERGSHAEHGCNPQSQQSALFSGSPTHQQVAGSQVLQHELEPGGCVHRVQLAQQGVQLGCGSGRVAECGIRGNLRLGPSASEGQGVKEVVCESREAEEQRGWTSQEVLLS